MSRPKRKRKVLFSPNCTYFKPAGIKLRNLEEVILSVEEMEALRLCDFLKKEQKQAAVIMNISQSTFHRIVIEARFKLAKALTEGKAVKIEGGEFFMESKKIENSKIAISSLSESIEGEIDERFGRCSFFLIVSLEDGQIKNIEVLNNNAKSQMRGGSGVAVAQMLAENDVNVIITENIGPRALDVLKQFQIEIFYAKGSIKEAIEAFKKQNQG
jgi:predicted DNA-binding protein (UPF0251 family)/predicted Fe-Mo cluster-binding NifX family protein